MRKKIDYSNIFFYSYLFFIIYIYISKFPDDVNIVKDHTYNIDHLLIFLLLGILARYSQIRGSNISIKIGFLFSLFLEFTHYLLPYRSFEFIDLIYNFFGFLIGIYIIIIVRKYLWRNY